MKIISGIRPVIIVLIAVISWCHSELDVINEWGLFEFDTPFNYPKTEDYTPARTVFTGFEVGWDKIYLCLPRFQGGAPTTLGFIPRNKPGAHNNLSPPIQVIIF